MKIYKTPFGFTAVKDGKATMFTPSLKRVKSVGVAPNFSECGTLLRGRALPQNVLYQIISQL